MTNYIRLLLCLLTGTVARRAEADADSIGGVPFRERGERTSVKWFERLAGNNLYSFRGR